MPKGSMLTIWRIFYRILIFPSFYDDCDCGAWKIIIIIKLSRSFDDFFLGGRFRLLLFNEKKSHRTKWTNTMTPKRDDDNNNNNTH